MVRKKGAKNVRKRCPQGTRRDRKTGECVPVSQLSEAKKKGSYSQKLKFKGHYIDTKNISTAEWKKMDNLWDEIGNDLYYRDGYHSIFAGLDKRGRWGIIENIWPDRKKKEIEMSFWDPNQDPEGEGNKRITKHMSWHSITRIVPIAGTYAESHDTSNMGKDRRRLYKKLSDGKYESGVKAGDKDVEDMVKKLMAEDPQNVASAYKESSFTNELALQGFYKDDANPQPWHWELGVRWEFNEDTGEWTKWGVFDEEGEEVLEQEEEEEVEGPPETGLIETTYQLETEANVEVERLRAEVARLKAENAQLREDCNLAINAINPIPQEIQFKDITRADLKEEVEEQEEEQENRYNPFYDDFDLDMEIYEEEQHYGLGYQSPQRQPSPQSYYGGGMGRNRRSHSDW